MVKYLAEQQRRYNLHPEEGLKPVTFDDKFGYPPSPGLVGFAKNGSIRKLTNMCISVEGRTFYLEWFDTSGIADFDLIKTDKALLIGDTKVLGTNDTIYTASLVDLPTADK